MSLIQHIFGRDKALIGMVHVAALPGTPAHALSMDEIVATAVDEAMLLAEAGFHAVILENMHDAPYLCREVGPEIIAGMTAVTAGVRDAIDLPLGVQVLAGANCAALAVAHTTGAQFIRAEGFVFAHVADEGLMNADAGPLLRYRRSIGADPIAVFADIKKKHSSHAITSDVSLGETIHAAEFFGADGVVITGTATGLPVEPHDLASAREASELPVLIGSGVTPDSAASLLRDADALIVGSWYKQDGLWSNGPDPERVRAMVEAVNAVV